MGNSASKCNSHEMGNRPLKSESDCDKLGSSSLKNEGDSSDKKMTKGTSKSESGSDKMDSNSLKSSSDKKIASTSKSDSEKDITMKRDKSLQYHNNGVQFVQTVKVSEPESLFLPKAKNVIGLDFGTSTIAVFFVTSASDKFYQFKIQEDDVNFYTPIVLLIYEHDKVEIGSRALRYYTRLEVDVNNSIFFDKVKLELQHNKVNILNNQNLM